MTGKTVCFGAMFLRITAQKLLDLNSVWCTSNVSLVVVCAAIFRLTVVNKITTYYYT